MLSRDLTKYILPYPYTAYTKHERGLYVSVYRPIEDALEEMKGLKESGFVTTASYYDGFDAGCIMESTNCGYDEDVIKRHFRYLCKIRDTNNVTFDDELNIPVTMPEEMFQLWKTRKEEENV